MKPLLAFPSRHRLPALCAGLLMYTAMGAAQAGPQVQTANGVIEGASLNGTNVYRNIPYAKAPVGDLRWKAPQPATPWQGVLQAVGEGKYCAQGGSEISADKGEEDCLVVHVTTPAGATPSSNLPVMFWIHGGAFMEGSGRTFDATELVKKNVIVVSINYRLGAFGFLALNSLRNEASDLSTGNYGLLDQNLAMQWAKNNIQAFGGNPANVTIAGESAGAMSALMHLTMPKSAGLFKGVIAQSPVFMGEGGVVATLADAVQKGDAFADRLGCAAGASQLACLRGKSVAEVAAQSRMNWSALQMSTSTMIPFAPVVDGVVLPANPATSIQRGNSQAVPVLIGTNRNEAQPLFAVAQFVTGHPLTSDEYNQVLQNMAPSVSWVAVRGLYPVLAYGTPAAAGTALLTDSTFACAAGNLRKGLERRASVYGYEFNDPQSPSGFGAEALGATPDILGAGHTDELPYIFNRQSPIGAYVTLNASQLALSGQMVSYWTNFMKSGNPNGSSLPTWKPFDSNGNLFGLERGGLLQLKPNDTKMFYSSVLVSDFNKAHNCALWDTVTPFLPVVL
ncbi:carboxylesterase family protein [Pseudomonas sp. UL073]|uniref:Carboxylic ester hydrolase n=1 Tax=Zestomonas insulae TaxID=2809017 RepID=A0ABS2IEF5_9GAMM|nr:carboxylesterase family protein [Pseudomonas insulae]MBM7061352.1 carboxylesterase family protein [Pseudomonas insulae]